MVAIPCWRILHYPSIITIKIITISITNANANRTTHKHKHKNTNGIQRPRAISFEPRRTPCRTAIIYHMDRPPAATRMHDLPPPRSVATAFSTISSNGVSAGLTGTQRSASRICIACSWKSNSKSRSTQPMSMLAERQRKAARSTGRTARRQVGRVEVYRHLVEKQFCPRYSTYRQNP